MTVTESPQRSECYSGYLLLLSLGYRGGVSIDCCGSHQVQGHGIRPSRWSSSHSVCRGCCGPKQSGRSPKVVALFSATNFSSNIVDSIASTAWHNSNLIKLCINPLWYSHKKLLNDTKVFVKIHFFSTKFSSIFLLHGKHSQQTDIFIFFIFRTLQVNKWSMKNQTFLSFCEINATKLGMKN